MAQQFNFFCKKHLRKFLRHSSFRFSNRAIMNFPCQEVESHNKPEVELKYVLFIGVLNEKSSTFEFVVEVVELEQISSHIWNLSTSYVFQLRVLICRNEAEKCFIETSINSLCISLKVKQADALENIPTKKFLRFLSTRAEAFRVLRRKPVQGKFSHYQLSLQGHAETETDRFYCSVHGGHR